MKTCNCSSKKSTNFTKTVKSIWVASKLTSMRFALVLCHTFEPVLIRSDTAEQIYAQLPTLNQIQLKTCSDRFDEQIEQCDQDLRKMLIECQRLKDEEHNEAEYYYRK